MSGQWVVCRKCSLKFRLSEVTCPRCETQADVAQVRWTEQRGPAAPEEGSGLAFALPVGLLLAGASSSLLLVTFGGLAAGEPSAALLVAGLIGLLVGWVWAAVLAWRAGVPSFLLSAVPLIPALLKREWKTALPTLGGVALIAAGAFFAPPGYFHTSKQTHITRLCEKKAGEDCTCVGTKAVELMSPEERAADFDADSAALREFMLTASQLCLKSRLVTRCVAGKQGTELQCICLVDKAGSSFTTVELELLLMGESAPPKYSAMRNECVKR